MTKNGSEQSLHSMTTSMSISMSMSMREERSDVWKFIDGRDKKKYPPKLQHFIVQDVYFLGPGLSSNELRILHGIATCNLLV